ncbi:MAG: putative copper-exporting P-type ATPase A [Methanobacterium sp. PtaU1.Bin242]|nr:MAG: putative copper-exporting P-type ATPase A [Methanobacterium sp. PtaU1.Bin242]
MADDLDIKNIPGLSEEKALSILKEEGYNELPSTKKRSIFTILFEVVREPMFLLLIASGTIYLFLGSLDEALMLLGFVFVIIGITFYQERKTERTLEALRDLSSPRALVIRGGKKKRIPGREVVKDDILILEEGDRVPADAVVLSCSHLLINESLLTGESVPVRKVPCGGVMDMHRPGGDGLPSVYSGTLVVQGQGIAQVQSTGLNTEMGKIGKRLETLEEEDTSLQKETRTLVRNFALAGVFLCFIVIVVYGVTRLDWLNGFLAGITLAMAILPEEIPVVLTIFLALGAWRISKKKVLTRRSHAIQALGSASVLCVDKTGTLTLNQMSVHKIFANGNFYDLNPEKQDCLPENFHELVEFSILASQRDPFDPMEKAIKSLGEDTLSDTEHLHDDWTIVREYPLSGELLAMSHVWKSPDGEDYIIAAKGAPEAIADLCHLNEIDTQGVLRNIKFMADDGLRIIAVAKSHFKQSGLPVKQHDFTFEFLGLIGFIDPVRPGVRDAVQECYDAGLRVVMITGDYPGTAGKIAEQIGLSPRENVITGDELDEMDDEKLQKDINDVNIFARVVPEQKLRLVNALKANDEIVVMTGDGVNDAPALKSAHIGISMGDRGTDVAREASSLVLLNDDFSSIVDAVRMGRRIFDNLKKAVAYIFAVHIPIIGMSLIPVFFNLPLVLLPVQIVFLELIIDPSCSIVFEAEPAEANVMNRPPRSLKEPLFDRKTIVLSILQGISVLIIVLSIYAIALYQGSGDMEARALSFTTLIAANIGLILTNRSWSRTIFATLSSPNKALWWVIGGAFLFLGLVLYTEPLRNLFGFSVLNLGDLLMCLIAGFLSILWFEALKYIGKLRNY